MATNEEERSERAMEPWEQHHAVIKMPRYAYDPTSALHCVGFLITCTFRREKSATKETLALLQEYMKKMETGTNGSPKIKRTPSASETEEKGAPEIAEVGPAQDVQKSFKNAKTDGSATNVVEKQRPEVEERECSDSDALEVTDDETLAGQDFILVKLATMGVIYISAPQESPKSVLAIVSRLVEDVQRGLRGAPQWCHRILPVQATCSTQPDELQAVVYRLVKDHLGNELPSSAKPLNYGVAFKRRGGDVAKSDQIKPNCLDPVFGRDECIKVVTAAVNSVTPNLKVDLSSPKMVVIVELIPIAGAKSSQVLAVSVLPGDIVLSKPKLNVKPLAPTKKPTKKRKHQ